MAATVILWLACGAPEDTDPAPSSIPDLVRGADLAQMSWDFAGRGIAVRASGGTTVVLSDRALYLFGASRTVIPLAGRALDVDAGMAWVAGERRLFGVDVVSGRIVHDLPLDGVAVDLCARPLSVVVRDKGLLRLDPRKPAKVIEEAGGVRGLLCGRGSARIDDEGVHLGDVVVPGRDGVDGDPIVLFGDPGRMVRADGAPLGVLPIRTAAAAVGDGALWAAGDELVHYDTRSNVTRHRRILPGPAVDLCATAATVTVLTERELVRFSADFAEEYRSHDPLVGLWTDGAQARGVTAGGQVSTWNLVTGERTPGVAQGPARAMADKLVLSRDGRVGDQVGVRHVASHGERTVYVGDGGVWGVDGDAPLVIPDRPRGTGQPALGPDGRMALPLVDGAIQVLAGDKQLVQIAGQRDADGAVIPVEGAAFFPDGKRLVLVRDGAVTIYDAVHAAAPVIVPVPKAKAVAVDPLGRAVYVAAADGAWVVDPGGYSHRLSDAPASSVAAADAVVLFGGDDGVLRQWRLR